MNMIQLGSTITTEAWNFEDKPNMDWNHAWGASPGNLITRFVLGLQPITAGFGQILIRPQLGAKLNYAAGVVPTIRGPVSITVSNTPGNFRLLLNIPGNVTATVVLPASGLTNAVAQVDGEIFPGALANNWLTITNIGAGQHTICLNKTFMPSATTLSARNVSGENRRPRASVDNNGTAVQLFAVELFDGLLGFIIAAHFDKTKTT